MIKATALAVFAGIAAAGAGLGLAIKRAMSFDVLERSLEVVAGTAEEAGKQLTRLKELARLPGLGIRQAIEASIALQIGFQTAIKDTSKRVALAEDVIKQFSNAIALTGGGPEVFQRVITQLTQMSNAGKVLMTDLRPIIQAAPALGQSLIKAFGTISPEEINALGLSSEQFMRQWVAALAELKRAPDTAANAWTNFTVAFDLALVKIGKPFLEPLTKALNTLEPLLDELGTRVSALFTMIGQDAVKLWANLPDETKSAFQDVLGTVTGLGGQIVTWIKDNYGLMKEVVSNGLNQIAAFWQSHGAELKQGYTATLGSILESAQLVLQVLAGDWIKAWQSLGTIIELQGPRLKAVVSFLVRGILEAMEKSKDVVERIGISLGVAIVDGVRKGIKTKTDNLLSDVKLLALQAVLTMRSAWAIHSPSQAFFEIGSQAVEGLRQGLQAGQGAVQQTLAELLDLTSGKFTKQPKKPAEAASKQIADLLRKGAEAIRDIGGKESSLERVNRLLSDPSVAQRIDERTAALVRQAAAIDDTSGATRARRVIGDLTRVRRVGFDVDGDILSVSRDRRVGEDIGALTRPRIADEAARANQDWFWDQAVQNAERVRARITNVADDLSNVFANAVDDWTGSIGGFFRSVGQGFADLLKRMISQTVFSGLSGVFQNLIGRVFGGGSNTGTSGRSLIRLVWWFARRW